MAASVLTFNESLHEYRLNGTIVPSVTQVTKSLTDYSMVPPAILNRKRDLGIALHKAIEIYLEGKFSVAPLPDTFLKYFDAFVSWLAVEKFRPDQFELRVFSDSGQYAGTLDLTGTSAKGKRAVVDYKTTAKMMPAAKVQIAGYAQACREMGDNIDERYVLQLKPNGTYVFVLHKEKQDFALFNHLLQAYHYQEAHGVAAD
jgi:hypothetical protein